MLLLGAQSRTQEGVPKLQIAAVQGTCCKKGSSKRKLSSSACQRSSKKGAGMTSVSSFLAEDSCTQLSRVDAAQGMVGNISKGANVSLVQMPTK